MSFHPRVARLKRQVLSGFRKTGGHPAESNHPPFLSPHWGTSRQGGRDPALLENVDAHQCAPRADSARCPSVFATEPHGRVTDRYGFVPYHRPGHEAIEQGWFRSRSGSRGSATRNRHGFQRHMLRFRREQPTQVGDFGDRAGPAQLA